MSITQPSLSAYMLPTRTAADFYYFRWEDIVLTTGEPVRNIDIVCLGRSPLSESHLLAASCNGLESLFAFFNVQPSAVLLAITPDLHRSLDGFIVRLIRLVQGWRRTHLNAL